MNGVFRGRRRGALALLAALALVAAACGDDDDESSEGSDTTAATTETSAAASTTAAGGEDTTAAGATTTAAATTTSQAPAEDVDPEGVLRIPMNLQAIPPNWDTANPTPPSPNTSVVIAVYDTLMRPTETYGVNEPGLAKEVQYVDPQTVHIVLQEGVTFTDGTPFDAEAVKTGIEYNRDSESNTLSAERKAIESITVDGPLELTLHLNQPYAGEIITQMAYGDFLIPSPKALADGVDLATTPVGAGPFILEENVPGEKITLAKNPDFFQADDIRVAKIEFIHTPPGEAQITSLRSGVIDVGDGFSYAIATQLEGSHVEVEYETADTVILWGHTCKSRAPFDDLRVRQALNYGLDRDALNEAVYAGRGAPMWGWWAEGSDLYDPAMDDYFAYDPEKARQLLAEAGQSDLSFDMYFTPGGTDRAAEVVQAQWAEIGVTVNILPLQSAADFFPDAPGPPMNFFALQRAGIQKVARNLVPGSVGNVCTWDDPELNAAVNAVRGAEPGSPEEAEAWKEVDRISFETAANIYALFGVEPKIWNPDRIGDVSWMTTFQGRPTINYYKSYIKQ